MKKTIGCNEVRNRLTLQSEAWREPGTAQHLEHCADCRVYADRLSIARRLLRDHHGNVEPDSDFGNRVMARIPSGPAEVLGWAAIRLLPATVALALVLAWFTVQATPQPTTTETAAPTEDLLSWVIDPGGDQP